MQWEQQRVLPQALEQQEQERQEQERQEEQQEQEGQDSRKASQTACCRLVEP
jgi:hypothetical protein